MMIRQHSTQFIHTALFLGGVISYIKVNKKTYTFEIRFFRSINKMPLNL